MRKNLKTFTTVAAIVAATSSIAHGQETNIDGASPTIINPETSIAEDIAYLRDVIAIQTLRLDSTDQKLQEQTDVIQSQALVIAELKRRLGVVETTRIATARAVDDGQYVVRLNDTLYSIAQEFKTDFKELARINNLKAPYVLQVSQRLIVPALEPEQAPSVGSPPALIAQTIEQNDEATSQKTENKPEPAPTRTAQADTTEKTQNEQTTRAQTSTPAPQQVAQNSSAEQNNQPSQNPDGGIEQVGVRPEDEDDRPYLAIFSDVAGILTPRGTLFVEPSFDFTVSSDNRFFFQGIEIVDAVLIGAIEATDSDRRATTESFAARYGVTNRFEVDGRVSYIQRDDRISGVAIDDSTTTLTELTGSGFGDAEIGLHYQLNGGKKWPFTVANLRVKAPTGTGPFEIDRTETTFADAELATGSGFWTIEPSATFILSSDPAVLFANIGYQFNLESNPNEIIGGTTGGQTTTITRFNPGNAIRSSIGVGLSLNERLSLNFGYDQSFFFNTSSDLIIEEADGTASLVTSEQPSVTVGSFLFGGSYAVNDKLRMNLNAAIGATDEAPDARIGIRAQYKLFD